LDGVGGMVRGVDRMTARSRNNNQQSSQDMSNTNMMMMANQPIPPSNQPMTPGNSSHYQIMQRPSVKKMVCQPSGMFLFAILSFYCLVISFFEKIFQSSLFILSIYKNRF